MTDKQFSEDYLEGYTKAKEEDKEEVNKACECVHNLEHEYAILKEENAKNAHFIHENAQYIELGKSLKLILDYLRKDANNE